MRLLTDTLSAAYRGRSRWKAPFRSLLLILAIGALSSSPMSSAAAKTMFGCKTPSSWAQLPAAKQESNEAQVMKLSNNPSVLPKHQAKIREWVAAAKQKGDAKAAAVNGEGLAFLECLQTAFVEGLELNSPPILQTAEFDHAVTQSERLDSSNKSAAAGATGGSAGSAIAGAAGSQSAPASSGKQVATVAEKSGKTTPINKETGKPCISIAEVGKKTCPMGDCRIRYVFENSCAAGIHVDTYFSNGKKSATFCQPGKRCDAYCFDKPGASLGSCPLTSYSARAN